MFLAECFLPGVAAGQIEAAGVRAADAAADLTRAGVPVEYLGALLVAEDEVVFHAFRARSAADALEASRRASLTFERVIESIRVDPATRAPEPVAGGGPQKTTCGVRETGR